ncbi:MAG: divergent PAP2 family protein [Clostridia bacterium]|nr:divergent PAP2 family protein [Clostridia bacterium]
MWLKDFFGNEILITAVVAWFVAQVIKFFTVLIEEKRINFERLVGSGGMPSSHASFVTALTTSVGLNVGFSSPLFAVCFVFSFVVMYDASGVRRAAGKQAELLNKLVENFRRERLEVTGERLKELLGHTHLEVVAGAVLGAALAILEYNIF